MALIETKTIQLYSGPGFKVQGRIFANAGVTQYWELKQFTEPKIVFKVND